MICDKCGWPMVTRIRQLAMQPTVFAPASEPRYCLESTCTKNVKHRVVTDLDGDIPYYNSDEWIGHGKGKPLSKRKPWECESYALKEHPHSLSQAKRLKIQMGAR